MRDRKLKFYTPGPSTFPSMKIFPLGGVRGAECTYCKFGTPHRPISETIRATKLKLYRHLGLDRAKYSFKYDNF